MIVKQIVNRYDFISTVDCRPTDCPEDDGLHSFSVSVSAANYCWQDLQDVGISASLIIVPKAHFDTLEADYAIDPDSIQMPSHIEIFYNGNDIAGIAHVTSDQVEFSNIKFTSLKKEHYGDQELNQLDATYYFTDPESSFYVSDTTLYERATYAAFTYKEQDVPLETVWYTMYSGSLEVSYNLGSSSRRVLLQQEADQASVDVNSQAVSFQKVRMLLKIFILMMLYYSFN